MGASYWRYTTHRARELSDQVYFSQTVEQTVLL